MILLPSAAGTMSAPPLIEVPTEAVVIDRVWQKLQPIASKRFDPACASAAAASAGSRGGALGGRLNAAELTVSVSVCLGTWALWNPATEFPDDVFSGQSRR